MACGQDMQLKGERCGYGRAVARKSGWPLCFTVARFTLALQPCNILVGFRSIKANHRRSPPRSVMGYEPPAAWACVAFLLGAGAHLPDSLCLRALAAVGLAYLVKILWQNRRYSGEPPVVWSWIPFLGSAIAFGKAPLAWLRQSAADLQSDVFVAIIAGERTTFATDPVLTPCQRLATMAY